MSSSTDRGRRLLPLLPNHPLGRSAVTCKFRCGDACAHEAPNTSGNTYFGDVVGEVVRRRGLLKAGAVLAVAGAGAGLVGAGTAAAAPHRDVDVDVDLGGGRRKDGLNFTAVTPNTEDRVVVPDGYEQGVVIRWGDPVVPGAPAFDFDRQTAAAQAKQFGFNNDFCGLVPLGHGDRWLMVSNHEYTTESAMFKGWTADTTTREQVEIAWAAHGMSVVLVERDRRSGRLVAKVDRQYNRRITLKSEFRLTGPAAGSALLKTSADPTGTLVLGTMNNCAGGVTPWGTILSGEENFNQYFANAGTVTDATAKQRLSRYGLSGGASQRRWEKFDERFDVAREPNEVNRFGWVVEVDPLDPTSTPVKHTALGRFKHEGANVIIARDGRVVAYMGDDERFDYMYKFVSDEKYKPGNSRYAREHNKKLLDKGTLYVAKFTGDSPAAEVDGTGRLPADGEFDGRGEWIPLASGDRSFVPGFTAEEVYVFTRLAADAVSPTKMDRPEDVEPNPRNRRVYAALTNNTDRGKAGKEGPTEPNPRPNNRHGHVLELEDHRDNTATTFSWRLLLVCGDPNTADTYFGGYDKSQVSSISCPDNVAFDSRGNLWISTDGNALGSNDGLFAVPVEGRYRGRVKQFLTVPRGAETCGPVVEDDFVLVSVQHPGEIDGASADNPLSHWPDGGATQPRPAVVAAWKKDKGRICG
ncbi:PhoX family protein [Saccharothrix syringae]|uniref:PhoX family phosphatase n=1 Tax=Saccharothrix syringae TaxID=103733 RepID=A0A5Q0HD30_SACSY|nr:PhoX family phosphatase [Saccharothrix syringae]QFZ23865.1 PhoX family phosphatase [Saccharothrix syringae]